MGRQVSVIVPVYNPGPEIDRCIRSLQAQTLPPEEWEAVFVDDRSTDGTGARLDRLAGTWPNVTVHHQENSGWPSRPRNVGIGLSEGTFVQFLDQDDELAPEALHRLLAMAERNGSEIVLGKAGGTMLTGAGVWRATVESCPGSNPLLMDSLTPHKLFRREFLDRHGIRFPESRRRLEDQIFMVQAYLAADRVSILADYTCYYWQRRADDGNASQQRTGSHAKDYYGALRQVFDLIDAAVPPGPTRDRLQARFFRVELYGRLQSLPQLPEPYLGELYREIRTLALERLTPGIERGLSPMNRARAFLTAADRPQDLLILAERLAGARPHVRLQDLQWHGGRLRARVAAEMRYADGRPIRLLERGGHRYLEPRLTAGTALSSGLDLGGDLGDASLHALLGRRGDPAEWFVPAAVASRLQPERRRGDGRHLRLLIDGTLHLDPAWWAAGSRAADGIWDLLVGVQVLGLGARARLGATRARRAERGSVPCLLEQPARVAKPYWTRPAGNLSVQLTRQPASLVRHVTTGRVHAGRVHAGGVDAGAGAAGQVRLGLDVAAAPGAGRVPVRVVVRSAGRARNRAGAVTALGARAVLQVPAEAGRRTYRLELREGPRLPPVPVGRVVLLPWHRALVLPPALGMHGIAAAYRAVLPEPSRRLVRSALRRLRRARRRLRGV